MKILPINLNRNNRFKNSKNNSKVKDNTANYMKHPKSNFANINFSSYYTNNQETEIQKAKNALFRQKPLSNGVGFYGPDSIGKEKAFNNFIRDLKTQDYEIIYIPTQNEATPDQIASFISNSIHEAESRYEEYNQKTALVFKNIELIHNDKILRNIKKIENPKEKGYVWIWEAQDKDKIDKTLIRRTDNFILAKPSEEDSKQVWIDYIDMINHLPNTNYRASLLREAIGLMPKVFPIKLKPMQQIGLDKLKENIDNKTCPVLGEMLQPHQSSLSDSINTLTNMPNPELDPNTLKHLTISSIPLVDYWLSLSKEDISTYTPRLKDEWLDNVLQNEEKTSALISQTLDKLEQENSLINEARNAYREIIENEEDITPEQKQILIEQQDSKLFFMVVSNNLNPYDYNISIDLQRNTITTLRQLSKEKDTIRENARENVFNPARKLDLEDEEADDIVNFIFEMLNEKALTSSQEEKDELRQMIEEFEQAKDTGDYDKFNSTWQNMINSAQNYFETDKLNELTNRNIELLNSINKNMKDDNINPRIKELVNSQNLSIEQREFVSRYKDDKNFVSMIKNSNMDIEAVIEELVYFEAGNKNLIQEAELNDFSDYEFNKMMSDKFHQIDSEAKDINIQGGRIVSKLDDINSSINSQSGIITDFANNFADYGNLSLELQSKQLQQMFISNSLLSSIDENTKDIKAYTKAQLETQLVQLQKDEYYRDIVPEITKLLPEGDKLDIEEYLSKVEDLAQNEKDVKRKKKIKKAALVILGTVVATAAIYFAGPAVVAHLASELPQGISAAQAMTSTASKVGTAKLVGNSGLIGFLGRSASQITSEINNTQNRIDTLNNNLIKYPKDTSYAAELDRLTKRLHNLYDELKEATKH